MKKFYDVTAYKPTEEYRKRITETEKFHTQWGAKRYAKKLAAKVPGTFIEICRVETPCQGIYYSEVICIIGEA